MVKHNKSREMHRQPDNNITPELYNQNPSSRFVELAGAYNSDFFYQELLKMDDDKYLPLSIISLDINGLRLINRSLGYKVGNKILKAVAGIIVDQVKQPSYTARIGGSQFAVLIPGTDDTAVNDISRNILKQFRKYNCSVLTPVTLAIGSSTRKDMSVSIERIYQQAEDTMYNVKFHQKDSFRSCLIRALKTAAWRHDDLINKHSERIISLTKLTAITNGLNGKELSDICLLAELHDIGKIGIPDEIISKPGPLNPEEYKIMQQHCKIGYHIALEIPGLVDLAEYILCHHEWWNGQGYPHGISGEQIPLASRIVSIVDAFDAMTNDRPYRKAMSGNDAINELKRMAGIQFDPKIVEQFLLILDNFNI